MITVENLHKTFGRQAVLNGLTFQAAPGQVTLLIGPNGAGKTTTLNILSGLCNPDRGTVWVAGHNLLRHRVRYQQCLSFLPQRPDFHPKLSPRKLLRFYARLRGTAADQVNPLLELVDLAGHADRPSSQLSGGMRQRLGLALLFLADSPVLILDEPGLSLDPDWRSRLKSLLLEEAGRGKTVLLATHLLDEWEGYAHRCLLCREGKIQRELDPGAIRSGYGIQSPSIASYKHENETQALFAAVG
jgi:heme ABC exporter ATP-binding subunit CcmA